MNNWLLSSDKRPTYNFILEVFLQDEQQALPVPCASDCARSMTTAGASVFSTDVNECDLLGSVCGEAQCVNVEGSFLCVCPDGRDYNVMTVECEPVPTGESHCSFQGRGTFCFCTGV